MSIVKHTQRAQVEGLYGAGQPGVAGALGQLAGALSRGLGLARRPAATSLAEERGVPSELFARCVGENSNREMDWLWAASQLERPSEQRYCLLRALEVNPGSQLARMMLGQLR